MQQKELDEILLKHRAWLKKEYGGERADLSYADLRGANLDFSCFPLWCGGLDVNIYDRQTVQLLYHIVRKVLFSQNTSDEVKKY